MARKAESFKVDEKKREDYRDKIRKHKIHPIMYHKSRTGYRKIHNCVV